ncbi:MAG TPA: oligopeptide/dipeptide ABC transporter ATP-binding protein [Burkholderiales bacterium]|nr:oligopeptide/dipeptide ABC transporter ATP-binding protein [Burkholderiales bacterium]
MNRAILEVTDLRKHYSQRRGLVSRLTGQGRVIPAVDGVSFYLRENETVGLVGESGCGKTTIGRTVLRLTDPTSGRIVFDGRDITTLSRAELRPLRREMQMIFQDLDAGLNPKMRVLAILREALTVHDRPSDAEIAKRIHELLEQVNLKDSKLANFPSELSGGEKRRVGIARVLAVRPRLIVADEPTSALDISIQAQVVNLLRDLQKNLGLSYLFISHDLPVVELVSQKVAVMYLGRIVEMGLSEKIAHQPRHPYTGILWSSLADKQNAEVSPYTGDGATAERGRRIWGVSDFEQPVSGCRFAPRCPLYKDKGRPAICTDPASEPQLRDVGNGHVVACHFA